MDLTNINRFLFTEANAASSQLQNVTFLANVFTMTFFSVLGIQTVANFFGEHLRKKLKQNIDKYISII